MEMKQIVDRVLSGVQPSPPALLWTGVLWCVLQEGVRFMFPLGHLSSVCVGGGLAGLLVLQGFSFRQVLACVGATLVGHLSMPWLLFGWVFIGGGGRFRAAAGVGGLLGGVLAAVLIARHEENLRGRFSAKPERILPNRE